MPIDLFEIRVTTINKMSADKLISLSENLNDYNRDRLSVSLNSPEGTLDYEAINALAEAANTDFVLYCLAIIHLYTRLENNRNEIIGKKLSKSEEIDRFLLKIGVIHKEVFSYEKMDEFREISNIIKHRLPSAAKEIKTKSQKSYDTALLKSLYENGHESLEAYLLDLYRKIHHKA